MAIINIDVQENGILARLKALEKSAADLQPVYERIGAGMVTQVQLGFKGSQDPWGSAWAKLKHRQGQPRASWPQST